MFKGVGWPFEILVSEKPKAVFGVFRQSIFAHDTPEFLRPTLFGAEIFAHDTLELECKQRIKFKVN